MAATTISRATITDDSGNGTSGTILNSAWFGTAIYDKIDALFTSTALTQEATNAAASVTHTTKNASSTGLATVALGTNSSDIAGLFQAFGSGYSTSDSAIASTVRLTSNLSGGMSYLVSTGAQHRFWINTEAVGGFISGGHFKVLERTTNPGTSDLTANGEMAIYMKGDTLVFAINDAATMRYLSIPLTGTGTTWTHGTSAP